MIIFQHGRSDWVDPRHPVNGPKFNWDTIEWVVLHYTAATNLIDGDLGEHADNLPSYLRAIHRDYLNRKPNGYSIGYNAAVDWLGGTWELRGDTFKAAANANPSKPGDENAKTFAILMLVDGQDPATPLAAAAVRDIVAQIRTVRPKVIVLGHRDVDATQCPGNGVYAQINAGVFEPIVDPSPPTPTPPPGENVNWTPNTATAAGVTQMPSVVDTKAQRVNDWAAIGLVKAIQTKAGLKPTGAVDQPTWDAANRFIQGK